MGLIAKKRGALSGSRKVRLVGLIAKKRGAHKRVKEGTTGTTGGTDRQKAGRA